jgi:hypothetical protein
MLFSRTGSILTTGLSLVLLGGCCNKLPGLGKGEPAGSSSGASAPTSTGLLPSLPSLPGTGPGASGAAPLPLAVGQWSRYRITRPGQAPSTFTYKVVGGGGNSPDFEIVVGSPAERKIIRMGVSFTDRHNASTWTVRSASVQLGPGKAITLPPAARKSVDQILAGATIASPPFQGPREDCSAPAGKFSQCIKTASTTRVLNKTMNTKQWLHSAVPIVSAVRSEQDDGAVMELEAYGTSGATPEP